MSALFRICYPYIARIMYRENGQFRGITSERTQNFVAMLRGINFTFVAKDSFGDIIDHKTLAYDGCLGSMQRNESDAATVWVTFPIQGPNLTQKSISGSDQPEIISSYIKIVPQMHKVQVLNMFNTFSSGVWLLILTYLSLLYVIILTSAYFRRLGLMRSGALGRKARMLTSRPGIKCFNIIIAGILKQPTSCNSFLQKVNLVRVLHLCLTIFALFVSFYLCSMIKTEKVTIKKPRVSESYADILDQDVRPLWLKNIGDHWDFERAEAGTMEAKIWQKALDMGINESLVIPSGFQDVMFLLAKVTSGKSVLITSRNIAGIVAAYACAASRAFGFRTDSFSYSRVDPGAGESLEAFASNTAAPVRESEILESRIKRYFEMAVIQHESVVMKRGLSSLKGNMAGVDECLLNRIVYPEPVITPPNLHHYRFLFYLTLTSYLFAAFVHLLSYTIV